MLKTKKVPTIEYDCYVLCGQKTEYTKDVSIDKRIGYIEGSGRLCQTCYKDTYPKGDNSNG